MKLYRAPKKRNAAAHMQYVWVLESLGATDENSPSGIRTATDTSQALAAEYKRAAGASLGALQGGRWRQGHKLLRRSVAGELICMVAIQGTRASDVPGQGLSIGPGVNGYRPEIHQVGVCVGCQV